jgi:hypothetical protein
MQWIGEILLFSVFESAQCNFDPIKMYKICEDAHISSKYG